ncbi:MAG TPA: hydrogenase iron-sulfur subunit [bacterium]|nr:hydrogenase iron-sulfur subunit [bacterium]
MSKHDPKIMCFSCSFGWGYLSDKEDIAKKVKNWVPVVCSGKVDSTHIITAFKEGADGVLILGCPEGDCHFQDGNYQTGKKVLILKKVLESYGVEPERLKMQMSIDPEGKTIPDLVKNFAAEIEKLGPVQVRPLREKAVAG